jgi:hypothetical protein
MYFKVSTNEMAGLVVRLPRAGGDPLNIKVNMADWRDMQKSFKKHVFQN